MICLSVYISLYVGSNAYTDERKVELLLIITRTNGFFSVDVSLRGCDHNAVHEEFILQKALAVSAFYLNLIVTELNWKPVCSFSP